MKWTDEECVRDRKSNGGALLPDFLMPRWERQPSERLRRCASCKTRPPRLTAKRCESCGEPLCDACAKFGCVTCGDHDAGAPDRRRRG
jgi:hypothetical protein